jgi:hypothetical protein
VSDDYRDGIKAACAAIELQLRRHFERLWPHDQDSARICRAVETALLAHPRAQRSDAAPRTGEGGNP